MEIINPHVFCSCSTLFRIVSGPFVENGCVLWLRLILYPLPNTSSTSELRPEVRECVNHFSTTGARCSTDTLRCRIDEWILSGPPSAASEGCYLRVIVSLLLKPYERFVMSQVLLVSVTCVVAYADVATQRYALDNIRNDEARVRKKQLHH